MFSHKLHCKFAHIGYFELLCLCLEGKNRMQLLGHGFPNAVSKSVTGRQLELVSQKRWLFYCSLMSSCVRLLLQMSDDALDCCQPPIRLLHLSVNSLFLIWTELSQALTYYPGCIYSCAVFIYNNRNSSGLFLSYIVLILMARDFQR